MSVLMIREGVFSVGVLNPNLRIFDIIMKTEFGTSYNAYLVKGEKTALIETVHGTFFEEYLDNLASLVDLDKIDYIILNHTEPDHSGALKYLLDKNPDIQVVGSMAAQKYAKAIVNTSFNAITVKDGDSIDLGGKTLKFIIAPFLHWPDSMFTWLEEDKILFSCDFLGCHYCEPRMTNDKIIYNDKYDEAFKYYYNVIFGPFKEHVVKGLEKINDLPIEVVAPSHGPILVADIDKAIGNYKKWSSSFERNNVAPKIVIAYVSAYGCTKRMAEEIQRGIETIGNFEVMKFNIIEHSIDEIVGAIEEADGVLFGSPTINRDAVKPVWDVLTSIDAISNKNKLCGVFGSYGWSGEAVGMIEERVNSLKLNLFSGGIKANFVPSEVELKTAFEYGQSFAQELM